MLSLEVEVLDTMNRLLSTTIQSRPLTHSRLKYIASIAQTTEDHVSRLGLGLSMSLGAIDSDWRPREFDSESSHRIEINEKQLRGKTLFKSELPIWMALAMRHQTPEDYDEWRQVMRGHWERGVEILMTKTVQESDWLHTIRACASE